MNLMDVNPEWAWAAYQPSENAPWNVNAVAHLFRRGGFGAPRMQLLESVEHAPAEVNNLGHPYYSTWVNWGRHTLGTIPFVIVFAAWMGAAGVLVGQAVGGALFAAIAWWLSKRVMDKVGEVPLEAGGKFARQGRLMALVQHRR